MEIQVLTEEKRKRRLLYPPGTSWRNTKLDLPTGTERTGSCRIISFPQHREMEDGTVELLRHVCDGTNTWRMERTPGTAARNDGRRLLEYWLGLWFAWKTTGL